MTRVKVTRYQQSAAPLVCGDNPDITLTPPLVCGHNPDITLTRALALNLTRLVSSGLRCMRVLEQGEEQGRPGRAYVRRRVSI